MAADKVSGFALRGISVHRATVAHPALSDVTLCIAQGEQVALIGPSGAGKTTLLHTLACAIRPVAGEFSVFGTSPWHLGHAERHALRALFFPGTADAAFAAPSARGDGGAGRMSA